MGSGEQDQTEKLICNYDQALEALTALPAEHQQLKYWNQWAKHIFAAMPWQQHLTETMTIAYARMAHRNGQLNQFPRSYHNELHINDLLLRVMYCAKHYENELTPNGLAILSFFSACHDLRQDEPPNTEQPDALVGSNETASFYEALRIIDVSGANSLWTEHHILLLKTMIEGSTFGSGGKRSKYFFQGNLAKHLLAKLKLPNKNDEQLVLLGCDLDTANVCLSIYKFAQSAVQVFQELITHQQVEISAHQFFSEQQKIYFFEQQAFNSDIAHALFLFHKNRNGNKLHTLSDHIQKLPTNATTDKVIKAFLDSAMLLDTE